MLPTHGVAAPIYLRRLAAAVPRVRRLAQSTQQLLETWSVWSWSGSWPSPGPWRRARIGPLRSPSSADALRRPVHGAARCHPVQQGAIPTPTRNRLLLAVFITGIQWLRRRQQDAAVLAGAARRRDHRRGRADRCSGSCCGREAACLVAAHRRRSRPPSSGIFTVGPDRCPAPLRAEHLFAVDRGMPADVATYKRQLPRSSVTPSWSAAPNIHVKPGTTAQAVGLDRERLVRQRAVDPECPRQHRLPRVLRPLLHDRARAHLRRVAADPALDRADDRAACARTCCRCSSIVLLKSDVPDACLPDAARRLACRRRLQGELSSGSGTTRCRRPAAWPGTPRTRRSRDVPR